MHADGWIAVDLDGTLAYYDGWVSEAHIGAPIAPMVERVKRWLADGRTVKIFTARLGPGNNHAIARLAIENWCHEHLGRVLEITATKDYGMIELWDDRCVQVITNTGQPLQEMVGLKQEI